LLKSITLKKYRGFENHQIDFKAKTPILLLGKNNAGKSTIIEVLRLCSFIISKQTRTTYKEKPDWVKLSDTHQTINKNTRGILQKIERLIKFPETLGYRYSEDELPYSKVCFDNGSSMEMFFNPSSKEVFAVLKDTNDRVISKKTTEPTLPLMATLPQIGPLNQEERILDEDYVNNSKYLPVTSMHFRNKLLNYKSLPSLVQPFEKFTQLINQYWAGITFSEKDLYEEDREIKFFIRENNFTAEIGVMGHGLQMWFQIIWFIFENEDAPILVIDEPDVYLHADLQNKLYQLLSETGKQIIIASHSQEFILSTPPSNIIIVSKENKKSFFANKEETIQKVYETLGYKGNLQLTKYTNQGKMLFCEGISDEKYLGILFSIMYRRDFQFSQFWSEIPIHELKTKSQYKSLELLATTSANSMEMKVYCVLDKDYDDLKDYQKHSDSNVNLTVWNYHELENYFINAKVLLRLLRKRKLSMPLDENIINTMIVEQLETFKDEIIDSVSGKFKNKEKIWEVKKCNAEARKVVSNQWTTLESKLSLAPGKEVLKAISKEIQTKYQISFTTEELLKNFKPEDIHQDIKSFFTTLVS
jgi:predicted ATP-dependent endonuclease of OLD family